MAIVTALAEATHITRRDLRGILIFLNPYATPTIKPSELTARANNKIMTVCNRATPNLHYIHYIATI
jgi:hypothetical protein